MLALTLVGAPGTAKVVIDDDGDEGGPDPAPFVALTVNVYAVLVVNPVIVIGELAPLDVIFPGLLVTV